MIKDRSSFSFKAKLKKQIWEKPDYRQESLSKMRENFWGNPALVKLLDYSRGAGSILDCGCGDGKMLEILWRKEANFFGIDISKRFIELGNKRLRAKKNITLQVGDAEKVNFPDEIFDLAYTAYALEHIDQPEKTITEMIRVTKKGGYLIFICPNYGSPLFPSPCSPSEGKTLISRAVEIFLKSHRYLFKKPQGLDWYRVYPKALRERSWQPDWDVVVEPYLQTLVYFLLEKGVKIIDSETYLTGEKEKEVVPLIFKQKILRLAKKTAETLGELSLPPYKFYGPSLFIVGKKR